MIYLDNAATTCPFPEVLDRVRDVAENWYANPHALHAFGVSAERLATEARKTLADCLRVYPSELVFTSGGTEANNLVILGLAMFPERLGRHVLASAIEHPSVLEPINRLGKIGFEVELLRVGEDGVPDPVETAAHVRPDTRLLSIMHVNNESGAILPVAEIIRLAKKVNPNLLVHVDAVQSFGKIPVLPKSWGADFVSFSAHKLHGPRGAGVLYIRKGTRLDPILLGGGQEGGMRSGTLNLPGICGFATAVTLAGERQQQNGCRLSGMKKDLQDQLKEKLQGSVLILSPENSSPYILQVAFEKVKSEVLLHHLAGQGIFVSSGSACASRKDTRSHVVKAMHIPEKWQGGVIRFSFSGSTTKNELELALEAVMSIYPGIRIR